MSKNKRKNVKFSRPKKLSYQETIRFHGHNGPFLALGYKLGTFLTKKYKSRGIMDLKITVKIKLEKPFTCIIDGLQCSTFATLGKRNMIVKKSRVENINVFVEKGTRKYIYKISKKAMDICLTAKDLSKAAELIFTTQTKNLWKIF